MSARACLIAMSVVLCAAAPAAAQKPAPPQVSEAASTDSAAATAGGDMIHALIIGSGLLDMMMEPLAAQMMPEIRDSMVNSPFYSSLSRRHRDALLAFIDSMPDMLRRELATEVDEIARRAGPGLAALMSAEELAGIADFMRSPSSRPLFQSLTQRYFGGDDKERDASDFSDEDMRIMAEFMLTPAGLAFYRNSDVINRIVQEEFEAATTRMTPRLQATLLSGMCAALENECPAEMRRQAQPT